LELCFTVNNGFIGDTTSIFFASEVFNIYYNPKLAGSSYLAGRDYKLTGGCFLMAAVPEPSTMLLLVTGLIVLSGSGRRKFKMSIN